MISSLDPRWLTALDQAFEQGRIISDYVSGLTPPDSEPGVNEWEEGLLFEPEPSERIMHALLLVMSGHSIEPITLDETEEPIYEYINLGDTGTPTIVFDIQREIFCLASPDELLPAESENDDGETVSM